MVPPPHELFACRGAEFDSHPRRQVVGALQLRIPRRRFASGEIARTMTLPEQEAKLRLVGDVARRIWG